MTRNLMRASAVFMGAIGLCATFLPQEILFLAGGTPYGGLVLVVQVLGALYVGFAMLDWMAQSTLIGGIYGRPVAIANLCHFTIGGLALAKAALAGHHDGVVLWGALTYSIFALLFARIVFSHPKLAAASAE